jgi:hypothetical protein
MTATERGVLEVLVQLCGDSHDDLSRTRAQLRDDMHEYSRIITWLLINKFEMRATQRKRSREYWSRVVLERLWALGEENN